MAEKELFGNSEQLDCSDCVNHGGDWDCDHIHCRKGTDTISRQAAIAYAISGRVRTLPTSEDGENWIRTEEVRQSLLTMPSAQQWIPCDKGEPDEDMECWVTVKTTDTLILLGRYNNPAANKVVFDYLNSQSARACRQNRLDWRAHRANEAKNHPPLRA